MKIFITGSSGFIGFHLSKKLLDKGHSVHGFDSMNKYYDIKLKKNRYQILNKYKKFSFTKGNVENQKILTKSILKFKPKIIIHLAAQAGVRYSIEKPRLYIDSNIVGTFNIIELAKKVNIKHFINCIQFICARNGSARQGQRARRPRARCHRRRSACGATAPARGAHHAKRGPPQRQGCRSAPLPARAALQTHRLRRGPGPV